MKKYTNAKYFSWKDFLSFTLILVQIVIGQIDGILYYFQIMIIPLIFVIYKDNVLKLIGGLMKNIR